jgi:hypothetical protein
MLASGGGRTTRSGKLDLLPVIHVAVTLDDLGAEVDGMAAEEEVVLGRHRQSVAREDGGVHDKCSSHTAGDAITAMVRLDQQANWKLGGEKNNRIVGVGMGREEGVFAITFPRLFEYPSPLRAGCRNSRPGPRNL